MKVDIEDNNNMATTKKQKAPGAPVHPLSAWILFTQNRRDSYHQKNPEAKQGELTRLMSVEWKDLSEEARKPFVDESKRQRDEYNEKLKAWRESTGKTSIWLDPADVPETIESLQRDIKLLRTQLADKIEKLNKLGGHVPHQRGKKNPGAPKRARTGYIQFTVDKRQEIVASNPDAKPKEVLVKLADAWKALDATERQNYNEKALKRDDKLKEETA